MGHKSSKVAVLPYKNDSFYVGRTKVDELSHSHVASGKGKFIDEDENIYMGQFKNNKYHGWGTMHMNYQKQLRDIKQERKHELHIKQYDDSTDSASDDGTNALEQYFQRRLNNVPTVYQGQWQSNCKHGKGIMHFIDGSKYEGDFEYDEIHGKGKFFYQSGEYYIGQFSCGIQHGSGALYTMNDAKIYDGKWLDNRFHGKGTFYSVQGKKLYHGMWKQGLAHGLGILYKKDETIEAYGRFDEGKLVENIKPQDEVWKKDIPTDFVEHTHLEHTFSWASPTFAAMHKKSQEVDKQEIITTDSPALSSQPEVHTVIKPTVPTLDMSSVIQTKQHITQNPLHTITQNTFAREDALTHHPIAHRPNSTVSPHHCTFHDNLRQFTPPPPIPSPQEHKTKKRNSIFSSVRNRFSHRSRRTHHKTRVVKQHNPVHIRTIQECNTPPLLQQPAKSSSPDSVVTIAEELRAQRKKDGEQQIQNPVHGLGRNPSISQIVVPSMSTQQSPDSTKVLRVKDWVETKKAPPQTVHVQNPAFQQTQHALAAKLFATSR